jgi:hypothetical protein
LNYINSRQAAEKWIVSVRRTQAYLLNKRIDGAIRIGRDWLIPKDAPKPADGRVNNRRQPGRTGEQLAKQATSPKKNGVE